MASQVKSQLSDKVYNSTLDDLLESDQGIEVDLYKINIFNKDICIAPGKVMNDAKHDIYYSFVYAIKNKRVAAKLGVYETRENRGDIYDLSQFDEGSLLLFDYYIQEPAILVEYQMPEEAEVSDNIFDYLKRYIKPVTNEVATIKTQSAIIKKITMRMSQSFADQVDLLSTLKLFRLKRPYDEEFLDSLKVESPDRWMFILIVLEVVFQVKFEFNVDGADELRRMVKDKPTTSTDVIYVNLGDTPQHVLEPFARPEEDEEDEVPLSRLKKLVTSKAPPEVEVEAPAEVEVEAPAEVEVEVEAPAEVEVEAPAEVEVEAPVEAPSVAKPKTMYRPKSRMPSKPVMESALSEIQEPSVEPSVEPSLAPSARPKLRPKSLKKSESLEQVGKIKRTNTPLVLAKNKNNA